MTSQRLSLLILFQRRTFTTEYHVAHQIALLVDNVSGVVLTAMEANARGPNVRQVKPPAPLEEVTGVSPVVSRTVCKGFSFP